MSKDISIHSYNGYAVNKKEISGTFVIPFLNDNYECIIETTEIDKKMRFPDFGLKNNFKEEFDAHFSNSKDLIGYLIPKIKLANSHKENLEAPFFSLLIRGKDNKFIGKNEDSFKAMTIELTNFAQKHIENKKLEPNFIKQFTSLHEDINKLMFSVLDCYYISNRDNSIIEKILKTLNEKSLEKKITKLDDIVLRNYFQKVLNSFYIFIVEHKIVGRCAKCGVFFKHRTNKTQCGESCRKSLSNKRYYEANK